MRGRKIVYLVLILGLVGVFAWPNISWAGPTPKVRLRGSIEEIENETLKARVLKLQARIENRGNRRTAHWDAIIDRLVAVHERLDRRRDRFQSKKKNVQELTRLLRTARQVRVTARNMVKKQDQKQYTLGIRNEDKIEANIAALREEERGDLQEVQTAVRQTIEAYKEAMAEAKRVKASKPADEKASEENDENEE